MSQFRRDPVTGRSVIIASGRAARPRPIDRLRGRTPLAFCPFCAGNEAMTPAEVWAARDGDSVADAAGWRVRVVPNKYPALANSGALSGKEDGIYHSMNGLGVHELIIESPDHITTMAALDAAQFARVFFTYRARLRAVSQDPRWRYVMIYKNHGERAGATFDHIHSQLVALPFVPREARDEIDGVRRHFDTSGRCIYCDIIQSESESAKRMVLSAERFVALCPFAPRFGYETWILPKHHAKNFADTSDDDIAGLADCARSVVAKLHSVTEEPPFNWVIHTAPNPASAEQPYHWHMEILPQLSRAAGFEWGTGVHMNSVAPEDAARSLRAARG